MNKSKEIVNNIVESMGTWNDLSAYERALIQYVVEKTLEMAKEKK